jgi:hypothetical protein
VLSWFAIAAAAATASVVACGDDEAAGPAPAGDAGRPDTSTTAPSDAALSADAAPTNIRGRVTYNGAVDPLGGATVKRGAEATTTGNDGSFSFDSYSAPYDLTVTYEIAGKKRVHILEGLTTATPEIEVEAVRPDRVIFGHVTGTIVRPGGFPMPSDHRIIVSAWRNSTFVEAAQANGSFDLEIGWRGTDTRPVTLHAIEYTGFPDFPTAYNAYGSGTVQISDGGPVSGVTLTLAAVSGGATSVTLTSPVPIEDTLSSIVLAPEKASPIGFNAPLAASPFSVTVPSIAGFPFSIIAGGTFVDGGGLSFDGRIATAGGTLALSTDLPLDGTPRSGATFEAGAPFSWSARTSGVFQLSDSDADGAIVLVVYTTKTSFTWPADLVPKSGTHQWRVAHYARANADAFAGPLPRALFGLTAFDRRNLIVP